jgi:hypothetical protein
MPPDRRSSFVVVSSRALLAPHAIGRVPSTSPPGAMCTTHRPGFSPQKIEVARPKFEARGKHPNHVSSFYIMAKGNGVAAVTTPVGQEGTGTWNVKGGLAQMLKGGVIMDVVNAGIEKITSNKLK